VAVLGPLDFVGHHLHLFAHFRVLPAHEALDRKDGVLGVGDGLTLGNLADQALAALGEGHDRGGRAVALGVGDDLRLAAFHHGDHAVGGPQVDSDDLAHWSLLLRDLLSGRSAKGVGSAGDLQFRTLVARRQFCATPYLTEMGADLFRRIPQSSSTSGWTDGSGGTLRNSGSSRKLPVIASVAPAPGTGLPRSTGSSV